MSIFTRQTGPGPLDGVTARLWAFTQEVLQGFNRFGSAQPASLKSLVQDNLRLLLVQTVARNPEFYSPGFVTLVEASSPVRFCYLVNQAKSLADRYSRLSASIRKSRRIDSLFELLN